MKEESNYDSQDFNIFTITKTDLNDPKVWVWSIYYIWWEDEEK